MAIYTVRYSSKPGWKWGNRPTSWSDGDKDILSERRRGRERACTFADNAYATKVGY
jgi:hypothetical protein